MAYNPYASQSISGYNSDPPGDDGSETANNTVEWAKHKDKLGDPLKNYTDAIQTEVSNSFAERIYGNRNSQSTTYTVQTSDQGKVVSCSGTFTVTLLATSTATAGWVVVVENTGSGTITIDGDGTETINGSLTIALGPGQTATLQSDGSNWRAFIHGVQIAIICDQKAQNTNGGTFTSGSDQTRDLNTEISDLANLVSISSNQFTLGTDGTYLIEAWLPCRQCDNNQGIIHDITGAADLERGMSHFANSADSVQTVTYVATVHTITASNTYEIRHRCATTVATTGFGVATNLGVEKYTMVKITKLG